MKSVLFVTSGRLGDAVLSTAVLDHVLRTDPDARVTVAAGPVAAPLFTDLPGLERLIALVKRKCGGHWLWLWRQVAARRWHRVVDLRGSALAWTLWARHRHSFSKPGDDRHRVAQMRQWMGMPADFAPRLWIGAAHHRAAAALLAPGAPILAVGPTANWRAKTWRAERFLAAIDALTGADGMLPGARVLVVGAPHERAAAAPLIEALPPERCIALFGQLPLLGVAACLSRAAFYLGNDSGLMHLAAAAGVPTLGLFGPTRENHYAPVGRFCATVRTDIAYDHLFSPGFDPRTADTLMDSLSVAKVVAAAGALLTRVRAEAA